MIAVKNEYHICFYMIIHTLANKKRELSQKIGIVAPNCDVASNQIVAGQIFMCNLE